MKNLPQLNPSSLIKQYGLHPKKRLGQNFLVDNFALESITATADISINDSVLEIGPGVGSLTRYLSTCAREVIAIEIDEELKKILKFVLSPFENIRLIFGDILKYSPSDLGLPSNYIVAANIPYNITSVIIRHLLESDIKPRRIVLTIQKEVAERICEASPEMSLLALSVQVYGKPVIAHHIPASAFYPVPKVDSAVVRIDVYPEPMIPSPSLPTFFKLIKAGFSQKRKILRNSLSSGLGISIVEVESLLAFANLDPRRRAETLSLEEWGVLTKIKDNA